MRFKYPSYRINEIVQLAKHCIEEYPSFEKLGEKGRKMDIDLEVEDTTYIPLRLVITAGDYTNPQTYRAALVLDNERIRGIDYQEIERKKFYKKTLVKGWHENIIDPTLSTDNENRNRHHPLQDAIQHLDDFKKVIAEKWNIQGLYKKEDFL